MGSAGTAAQPVPAPRARGQTQRILGAPPGRKHPRLGGTASLEPGREPVPQTPPRAREAASAASGRLSAASLGGSSCSNFLRNAPTARGSLGVNTSQPKTRVALPPRESQRHLVPLEQREHRTAPAVVPEGRAPSRGTSGRFVRRQVLGGRSERTPRASPVAPAPWCHSAAKRRVPLAGGTGPLIGGCGPGEARMAAGGRPPRSPSLRPRPGLESQCSTCSSAERVL